VNIHAPMSDNARAEARRKMFPERNLIAMKNRQIAYKPEKEYTQGLYTASRINDKSTVRPILFKDMAEVREAYRKGLINIDDPIDIQNV
jgi:isopentenyl diphosphate isomerase/L-lactate dehydrogenase-like FMN-dependent dehydrogenase